ncbi:uncharacterized protein J3D65DRAFT_638362 [Phyllosticta citribraziliensis]|uniref:Uncharacterized protein n=1 Tax=Phyllosticta citribraziliensis TaxID=989973 RepID=A0ABR1L8V0_9PEZI
MRRYEYFKPPQKRWVDQSTSPNNAAARLDGENTSRHPTTNQKTSISSRTPGPVLVGKRDTIRTFANHAKVHTNRHLPAHLHVCPSRAHECSPSPSSSDHVYFAVPTSPDGRMLPVLIPPRECMLFIALPSERIAPAHPTQTTSPEAPFLYSVQANKFSWSFLLNICVRTALYTNMYQNNETNSPAIASPALFLLSLVVSRRPSKTTTSTFPTPFVGTIRQEQREVD